MVFDPLTFTNTTVRFGFLQSFTGALPSNYSAMIINTSGSITCQNDAAGTVTTGGSYSLSTATWYRAKLTVNTGATSVTCAVYNMSGTQLNTTSAGTLPTAALGTGFTSTNSGTTATALTDIDYIGQWYTGLNLVR
jgi:hypothetical protein